jgi:peptidoglycan hydrolase CwlO-like protein
MVWLQSMSLRLICGMGNFKLIKAFFILKKLDKQLFYFFVLSFNFRRTVLEEMITSTDMKMGELGSSLINVQNKMEFLGKHCSMLHKIIESKDSNILELTDALTDIQQEITDLKHHCSALEELSSSRIRSLSQNIPAFKTKQLKN